MHRRRRLEGWRSSSIRYLGSKKGWEGSAHAGCTGTQVTDAGCIALAAALDSGQLPALKTLWLQHIPASAAAKCVHEECGS